MNWRTAQQTMRKACEIAGYSNFGADDLLGLTEALEQQIRGLSQLPFSPAGRERQEGKLLQDLVNRLRIERWYETHPEIDDLPIEGSVLVCGLPRTGTTAAIAMLALDPRFRFLRKWEGNAPVPPPVAGAELNDPRRLAAVRQAADYKLSALHLSDPDGPEEDLLILAGLNMRSYHGGLPMPDDFISWWMADDFSSTYAYLARVMKLLQSRRPPHLWLMKSPPHIFRLEAFLAQFPDTKFIWTHRDPAQTIPSVASLYQAVYGINEIVKEPPKHWTGARSLSFWAGGMRRGLAARDRIGEHRFIDVHNDDVVRDPIGTFENIYARLGMQIDAPLKASLETFHRTNAKGAHGAHAYTLEEYGLTREGVRNAFKDYVRRFDL